ncbi:MAG: DUF1211 domain-containing protein [Candidatus Dormibacteraeota bacterium]|nr:DUF1211 domain-containing protein [Candidatus Dormibacteraeota bacterium]MBV9525692.1 DUF1211 domain-containing protein [Candidatus Dormibacteraeota bacterium]
MPKSRVEAFSDGVFAVAITLLVLDLHPPSTHGSLLAALADGWPEFAAFALSFAVIGIIWVNHHAVFHRIARVDRTLLFLNLGLLLSVVLIPFVTALFALYIAHTGDQADLAGALYNADFLLVAIFFTAINVRVDTEARLRREHVPPTSPAQRLRFAAGTFVYAACIPLSYVNPVLALILDAAVAVFYIGDQLGSRTAADD